MIGVHFGRITRPDNSFHPAWSPCVCGMNARGRSANLSRIPRISRIAGFRDSQSRASGTFSITEHAPGIFHAEHHGKAEKQNYTAYRVQRGGRDPSWAGKCSHRGAGITKRLMATTARIAAQQGPSTDAQRAGRKHSETKGQL